VQSAEASKVQSVECRVQSAECRVCSFDVTKFEFNFDVTPAKLGRGFRVQSAATVHTVLYSLQIDTCSA
jgi:hypothetical protein